MNTYRNLVICVQELSQATSPTGITSVTLGKNMAKAEKMTEFERGRIVELQMQSFSQCVIAGTIKCSKPADANFLINSKGFGKRISNERPKKISSALSRKMRRFGQQDTNRRTRLWLFRMRIHLKNNKNEKL